MSPESIENHRFSLSKHTMVGDLTALLSLLRSLQKIDPMFPLQYAICLAEIARDEGLSLTMLAERTGMSLPTVSRIVGALSTRRQAGTPYGFVSLRLLPGQRRTKQLHLTLRGREAIAELAGSLVSAPRVSH